MDPGSSLYVAVPILEHRGALLNVGDNTKTWEQEKNSTLQHSGALMNTGDNTLTYQKEKISLQKRVPHFADFDEKQRESGQPRKADEEE